MRARIFKVFNINVPRLEYTYVDVAKHRDDVCSTTNYYINAPMMSIRLYDENGVLQEQEQTVFTTPEIIKLYTKTDLFELLRDTPSMIGANWEYIVKDNHFGYSWEIEFEMKRIRYPYLHLLVEVHDSKDKLLAPIVDMPEVSRIYKADWVFF